ncbi:uncharacterized protein LOC111056624 [Nilaparvata lugens]|uniref:uncharacterized protein LOC111056624 n=1 Tax=Nilaparvata lugens TaxID=108931 RepID=UPI00193EB910|nr:uncharacterized protein LOC111056624 [Nilaparvata lugens]
MNSQVKAAWKCDDCVGSAEYVNAGLEAKLSQVLEEITALRAVFEPKIDALSADIELLKQSKYTLEETSVKHEDNLTNLNKISSYLSERNSKLEDEINFLHQRSRLDNIEITGIPLTDEEDIYEVLEAVARVIKVPHRLEDISIAHRVPNVKGTSNIVLKFVARKSKIAWLDAAKKKQGLKSTEIKSTLPDSHVFINEHLAPHNKKLLGLARNLKKQGKLAFVWVEDCKVLVRKDLSSQVERITGVNDQ